MRIHSDSLTIDDLNDAMREARAYYAEGGFSTHGSRSRRRAFNVLLRGDSKRRPNGGNSGAADEYAATWDQWGVFLSVLFESDPEMTCLNYKDADDFHMKTNDRFNPDGNDRAEGSEYWPNDAHGDHRFEWEGVAREQKCKKCSAKVCW